MATCALDVICFPYLTLVRFQQCMPQESLLTASILCTMDVQFKDEIPLCVKMSNTIPKGHAIIP